MIPKTPIAFQGAPFLLMMACLCTGAFAAPKAPLTSLQAFPPAIHMYGAESSQRVVLQATYGDGINRDVTHWAKFEFTGPTVAKLDKNKLLPFTNGTSTLRITFEGHSVSVPVAVTNAAIKAAMSFKRDVMPVFMKAGCNAGACHGSSRGKDGFRLSLFGFDPDGDYYRLTREQIGRRINLAIPEESLIVQKGLGAVQHTGGVRFGTNSDLCRTLLTWLKAGAPEDAPSVPKLTGIEILPKTALLEGPNTLQRFVVQAHYSDDTERDVTALTVFLSNNDVTARISEDGTVTAGQRGEAFIQARFGEFNVGAQIIVIPKNIAYQWPGVEARNYIDEAVYAKLKKLRLAPSPVCDDAAFARRAFLDITGTLPSPEELIRFTENCDPKKREQLVDSLLSRKEFAELWVMKLAELLEIRSRENVVSSKAALVYFEWLRDQMLANVPLDRIVQNLITASGSNFRDPPANYYQIEPDTLKLSENTAQVFLGMRIQCAQCHNHPFDRWTMNDYYGFAAFFARVGRKPGDDPRETVIFEKHDGDIKHPVTGAVMRPKFLGGETPELSGASRREVLAKWLTSSENPYFARNFANIIWAHFLGRGIVEPVDDGRVSNPPSNPELLEALSHRLVSYHYDFRKLVRDICASRTYQLSSAARDVADDHNFCTGPIRRIRAEVLLDCISQVTETQDKFPGLPRGSRAVEIADGNTANYFLTTFGRASRTTVCSCEVKTDPNLSQALHLLNGDTLQPKIEQGGLVKRLLKEKQTPEQIIDELYLRCFSRKPATSELEKLKGFLKADSNSEHVLNDVFWSLLNAKEFVFNH
jgi:Protein of unknown function (DUF1553)/Protein of unknown function (DUF1549)